VRARRTASGASCSSRAKSFSASKGSLFASACATEKCVGWGRCAGDPVGVGVEVRPGERGEVVVLALQLAADLREMVAGVAQVLA